MWIDEVKQFNRGLAVEKERVTFTYDVSVCGCLFIMQVDGVTQFNNELAGRRKRGSDIFIFIFILHLGTYTIS